jgi:hypothetical protein
LVAQVRRELEVARLSFRDIAQPRVSAKRQAEADALGVSWRGEVAQLPAVTRLAVKEIHEALWDCGFHAMQAYRQHDGSLAYTRHLDREDFEFIVFEQCGAGGWTTASRYTPRDHDGDRSHDVYVRVLLSGAVTWRHMATPEGEHYGAMQTLGKGVWAAGIRKHFLGVAARAESAVPGRMARRDVLERAAYMLMKHTAFHLTNDEMEERDRLVAELRKLREEV